MTRNTSSNIYNALQALQMQSSTVLYKLSSTLQALQVMLQALQVFSSSAWSSFNRDQMPDSLDRHSQEWANRTTACLP